MAIMDWHPSEAGSSCQTTNTAGLPYEEFACLYPALGKNYFPFELNFSPVTSHSWMVDHPIVPIAAVVTYVVLILLGRSYFSTRKPWDWRRTMALWNLGLSMFSTIGFVRTAPLLIHNFTNYSVSQNFCFNPESHYGSGSSGLWVQLFILSKFPELLDTFFIVIHKKQLIFLHWYHHISVLLYCWHSYVTRAPTGLIFCVMNYAVHAIMYFYYFLMAVKWKPKSFKAVYITGAQISQMVVGVGVTVIGCYMLWWDGRAQEESCWLTTENNVAALIMYGSYLFLFLQFFLGRYFTKTTVSGGSKKVQGNGSTAKSASRVKKEE